MNGTVRLEVMKYGQPINDLTKDLCFLIKYVMFSRDRIFQWKLVSKNLPDLLNQSLLLNQSHRRFACTLTIEKHDFYCLDIIIR